MPVTLVRGRRAQDQGPPDFWEQGQRKEGGPLGPYGYLGHFTFLWVQTVLAAARKQTEQGGAKATARGGLPSLGKGGGSLPGSQPSSCLLFWAEIQAWGERPGLLASSGGEAPSQDQEQRKPEQCCSWRDWWRGS